MNWTIVTHTNGTAMKIDEVKDRDTKDLVVKARKADKDAVAIFIYEGKVMCEFIFLVA